MLKIKNMIIGFFLIVFSSQSFSHGGEKHDEKEKTDVKVENSNEGEDLSEKISPDALNLINNEYQSIIGIFQKACFDCHSHKTNFPWYKVLPLVSHLIEHDIEEAKKHLVMGESFPFEGHGSPEEDLEAIEASIKNDEMPPFRYQMMHWGSFLNEEEKSKITEWVSNAKKVLKK